MNFIIVLGSSNPSTRRARVEKAVDYYNHLMFADANDESAPGKQCINTFTAYDDMDIHAHPQNKIRLVFSGKGGTCHIQQITEAHDMRRIAVEELGVPESVCIVEPESQNTHENIINTLNLLQTYSWFKPTFYTLKPIFTICTSHFHAKRSLIIGMSILSEYGYVNIIHTDEPIKEELAIREKEILNEYIRQYLLPKMTVNY